MSNRVLVVDDDLYIRELYEEILRNDGFTVESATNGEEGLAKLQEGGYDVVLLDVMMPKVDGLGVLNQLHEHQPKKPNGAIILLTNLGHDPVIKDAMSKGASCFMIKADITPDQLLATVKKYLSEASNSTLAN